MPCFVLPSIGRMEDERVQSALSYLDRWSWRTWQRIEQLQSELQEVQNAAKSKKAAAAKVKMFAQSTGDIGMVEDIETTCANTVRYANGKKLGYPCHKKKTWLLFGHQTLLENPKKNSKNDYEK